MQRKKACGGRWSGGGRRPGTYAGAAKLMVGARAPLKIRRLAAFPRIATRGLARPMIDDLWYKNAVIYSLDLDTFMDANGDGVGDFEGLIRRLDYLDSLAGDRAGDLRRRRVAPDAQHPCCSAVGVGVFTKRAAAKDRSAKSRRASLTIRYPLTAIRFSLQYFSV